MRLSTLVSLGLTSILLVGWYVVLVSACPNNLPGPCPGTGQCEPVPQGNCVWIPVGNIGEAACWKLWRCQPATAQHCTAQDSPNCSGKFIKHPECAEWAYTGCDAQLRGCSTNTLYNRFQCELQGTRYYSHFVDCSC